MSNPNPYVVGYSFTGFQTTNPTDPLPADEVDSELADIATAIAQADSAIMDVRRSDGALKNQIVTKESLSAGLQIGLENPTVWATSTNYLLNDTVFNSAKFYMALVAHNSGLVFDATKWTLLADLTGFVSSDSGVMFTAVDTIKTVDYTILVGDAGKMLVANKATAIVFTLDLATNLTSKPFFVKNVGVGTLTLRAATGESIEGVAAPSGLSLPTGWMAFVWGAGTAGRAILWPGTTDIMRGPASSTMGDLASFSGTDGKTLADSGKALTDFGRFTLMAESIQTGDYTVLTSDFGKMLVANKGTAISFALLTLAAAASRPFFIRNIGAGDLTLTPNGAETIEGAATLVLKQGTEAMIWPSTTWRAAIALRVATQAEAIAGVATGVYLDALRVQQAIAAFAAASSVAPGLMSAADKIKMDALPITKSYTSPDQSITSAALLTLAHGFGIVPKFVTAELVCQTAEFGWLIGDVTPIHLDAITQSTGDRGMAVYWDATNVYVRYATGTASTIFVIIHKTAGTLQNLTLASWKLRVKAWA